jgi:hypothetical protein
MLSTKSFPLLPIKYAVVFPIWIKKIIHWLHVPSSPCPICNLSYTEKLLHRIVYIYVSTLFFPILSWIQLNQIFTSSIHIHKSSFSQGMQRPPCCLCKINSLSSLTSNLFAAFDSWSCSPLNTLFQSLFIYHYITEDFP